MFQKCFISFYLATERKSAQNCDKHVLFDLSAAMSSLPQGWHVTGSTKTLSSNSVRLSGSSVPVTMRKKWNSPQASNVPQTKLPSYKSSNLRKQNCNLNSTYEIKTSMTTSNQQTKLPVPTKPSPVKEYKDEIEKLKKELSTVKAENSILKAKVRRVDDENVQKGRQIEKLRVEIKALQKNESSSSSSNRKGKESQELLLLRQKCLRLEGALKERDLVIKKLSNESSSEKKEDSAALKVQLPNANKSIQKEYSSAKSSLSRASLSLKNEVTKLRDMIHKLEKENQDLQLQAKLHCQEIRRLKVQLKSKEKPTLSQSSASKSSRTESIKIDKVKPVATTLNSQGTIQTKTNTQTTFVPKQRLTKNVSSPLQRSVMISTSHKQPAPQKPPIQKNLLKNRRVNDLPNGSIPSQKTVKSIPSRLPSAKSTLAPSAPKPVSVKSKKLITSSNRKDSDLELKVQEMRETIAAKKIQRTWRHHQKCLHQSSKLEFQNEGKALTFIISSLKHHKLRKAKLNRLVKKKTSLAKKDSFIEIIQSVAKKVWDENENTS